MIQIVGILIAAIFSYLVGSVNSAITVCKLLRHEDIRESGSHNAGLTNVLRVYGKKEALITLLCDLFKGILCVVFARVVVSGAMGIVYFGDKLFIGYVAGVFAILGHIFPIYYGFKGGKGVLMAATTLIAIDPLTCLASLGVFAVVVAISKYVSLGSMCAAVTFALVTFFSQSARGIEGVVPNTIVSSAIAIMIIYMHRANIKRLINGNENKLSFKK